MRKVKKWAKSEWLVCVCLLLLWGPFPVFARQAARSCTTGVIKCRKSICSDALFARAQDLGPEQISHAPTVKVPGRIIRTDALAESRAKDIDKTALPENAMGSNEFEEIFRLFLQTDIPVFALSPDGFVTDIILGNDRPAIESLHEDALHLITGAQTPATITVTLSDDGRHVVKRNNVGIVTCDPGDTFSPLFLTDDGTYLYAISNYAQDFESLLRIDETGNVEVIFGDLLNGQDIGGIVTYGVNGKDLAAIFAVDDAIEYSFMSPELSTLHARATHLFPGADILWFNGDAEGRKWLCNVLRRDRPDCWYLFDVDGEYPQTLFEAQKIVKSRSAESVRYTTNDGMVASGYVTTPCGPGPYPMVVFVHGGPSARSYPWFDARVQALAQRGYAVFQPNYRGSRGLGKQWQQGGWKEWGTGVAQNDISDGVRYLIESGVADSERIAIFGGSFGGYAALAGFAFTPDLYKCGISFFGISDLASYLSNNSDSLAPFAIPMYGDVRDPIARERLLRQSPLYTQFGKPKPLFLYHGAKDPLVGVWQSDAIAGHIRNLGGTVEYYRHPGAMHGFIDPRHEAMILSEMLNFLDEHLLDAQRKTPPDEIVRALELMRTEGERAIDNYLIDL